MYWNSDHMDGGWAVVMMLGMLIFWTALVVAIIWAVASSRSSNVSSAGSQTPGVHGRRGDAEDILANRLARGEINPEEYKDLLDVLRSTNAR
jgi:putative membrane protein